MIVPRLTKNIDVFCRALEAGVGVYCETSSDHERELFVFQDPQNVRIKNMRVGSHTIPHNLSIDKVTGNSGICQRAALVLILLAASPADAQVCTEWKTAQRVGELQVQVDEASGLAASRQFPGRLYHINDSGDSANFYITNMQGAETVAVSVSGVRPIDTEALSLGPCGEGKSCLFIGDIGDNDKKRQTIEVTVVEELKTFPSTVRPKQRLKLRYPDGSHDAESLAVHPNGTIYILTKEHPARLYKADPAITSQTLVPVMTFDTGGFTPTDMAISDSGTRLLVLTYLYAMEFGIDLKHPPAVGYNQRILIQPLQQEESIAYLPGSRSFIYTSERVAFPAWIMRVDCGKAN